MESSCPYCKSVCHVAPEYAGHDVKCHSCGEIFKANNSSTNTSPFIACRHCNGVMQKTTKVEQSCALQLVGVLLFLIGIGMIVSLEPLLTLIGLVLLILAARLGYKKTKVWMCKQCGSFHERA